MFKGSDQSGMSLISVIVSTAIFGILMAGMSSMINFTIKTASGTEDKIEFLALRDRIANMLKYNDFCETALVGQVINAGASVDIGTLNLTEYTLAVAQPVPGSRLVISRIRLVDNTGAAGPRPVTIESTVTPGTFISFDRYSLNIEISAQRSGFAMGGGLVPIDIPFVAFVNQGATKTILRCASEADLSQACEESGGYYNSGGAAMRNRCRPGGFKNAREFFAKSNPGQGSQTVTLAPIGSDLWEICVLTGERKVLAATSNARAGCRVRGGLHSPWQLILTKLNASDGTVECWAYCGSSW
ncbi:hypothetical protein COB52_04895 [Candidatus Kaiserbacteria bacterium]|nr:MAG: hypothetical protein COB52_04895 [Candidatus Kaiserbacteria bacterium]